MAYPYPEGATDDWIDKTVNIAVARIEGSPETSDIRLDEKSLTKFLRRTVRGLMGEFLRQTVEGVGDMNNIRRKGDAAVVTMSDEQIKIESKPGVSHATSTARWMLDKKIPPFDTGFILNSIIKHTVAVFTEEYVKIDSRTPSASIPQSFKTQILRDAEGRSIFALPSK